MARKNTKEICVNSASPHTIKKFKLIEEYVKAWVNILMNFPECKKIIFIDCMCNSGIYKDSNGQEINGTPIRVANVIADSMLKYPNKKAELYFNDLSSEKIEFLKEHLPNNTKNFHIFTSNGDGNYFLKTTGVALITEPNTHYLLFYDPYVAAIDWNALESFLSNWGEVIINHMVSDAIRGVGQAKSTAAVAKYEGTYLKNIDELTLCGTDRAAYEERLQEIISSIAQRSYHLASFPFFNSKNGLLYYLMHFSHSSKGFNLFKETAWKTFGGKSSSKNTHGLEGQILLGFDEQDPITSIDNTCYNLGDIADYLQKTFRGKANVAFAEVWATLDNHPVFPSSGYRNEIKKLLKEYHNSNVFKSKITFVDK